MALTTRSPDRARIAERVRGLLGPERVSEREGIAQGEPESDQEVSDLLRVSREEGWRVLPLGAGIEPDGSFAREATAAPGGGPELILSSLRMRGLLEHEPSDLVFRARAGLRLSDLQERMSRERQWLALDPPGGSDLTLGGIVATGAGGPLRAHYGRPRDQLLGLTLVDGAGRILRLGGRVVKNVAGFDLVRLAAGSRGALGVITELTFRLFPLPAEDRTLVWSREGIVEAWRLGRRLGSLPLPISAAELVAGAGDPPLDDSGHRVLVRLTGSTGAVAAMREVLLEHAGHPLRELDGEGSRAAWHGISVRDGAGPIAFRIDALPDRCAPFFEALEGLPDLTLTAHLLTGGVRVSLPRDGDLEAFAPIAAVVRAVGGTLRVLGGVPGDAVKVLGSGSAEVPAVARLRSGIVKGFDPGATLPGSWRR